jgi:hypothetical protein
MHVLNIVFAFDFVSSNSRPQLVLMPILLRFLSDARLALLACAITLASMLLQGIASDTTTFIAAYALGFFASILFPMSTNLAVSVFVVSTPLLVHWNSRLDGFGLYFHVSSLVCSCSRTISLVSRRGSVEARESVAARHTRRGQHCRQHVCRRTRRLFLWCESAHSVSHQCFAISFPTAISDCRALSFSPQTLHAGRFLSTICVQVPASIASTADCRSLSAPV